MMYHNILKMDCWFQQPHTAIQKNNNNQQTYKILQQKHWVLSLYLNSCFVEPSMGNPCLGALKLINNFPLWRHKGSGPETCVSVHTFRNVRDFLGRKQMILLKLRALTQMLILPLSLSLEQSRSRYSLFSGRKYVVTVSYPWLAPGWDRGVGGLLVDHRHPESRHHTHDA